MVKSDKTILTLGLLVIAGVALFFIGSYVGNVVFSKRPALTTAQKQEVLNVLSNCKRISVNADLFKEIITGQEICKIGMPGSSCLLRIGTSRINEVPADVILDCVTPLSKSTGNIEYGPQALCCQP